MFLTSHEPFEDASHEIAAELSRRHGRMNGMIMNGTYLLILYADVNDFPQRLMLKIISSKSLSLGLRKTWPSNRIFCSVFTRGRCFQKLQQ